MKSKKDLIAFESQIDLSFIRCENHKNWEREKVVHEANFCSANFESGKRGNFSRIVIADSDMNHSEDMKIRENYFYFNYLPEEVLAANPGSEKINTKKMNKQSRFNNASENRDEEELFDEFYSQDFAKIRKRKMCQKYSGDFVQESVKRVKIEDEICSNTSHWEDESFESETMEIVGDEELLSQHFFSQEESKTRHKPQSVLSTSFQDIADSVDKDRRVVEKFALFLLNEKFRNYICLAHMGSKFDCTLMLEAFITLGKTET